MARDQLLAQVAGKAGDHAAHRPNRRRVPRCRWRRLKIVANYAVGFDNIDVDA